MKHFTLPFVTLFLIVLSGACSAAVVHKGSSIIVSGAHYSISLRDSDGAVVQMMQPGGATSLLHGGDTGLWALRFSDGNTLSATQVVAADPKSFHYVIDAKDSAARLSYASDDADVVVTVTGNEQGVDLRALVTPKAKTVLTVQIPSHLRFSPSEVRTVVCPCDSSSVGIAFNASFFKKQSSDDPASWAPQTAGSDGYKALFGDELDQRAVEDPPVSLQPTPDGKQWLNFSALQQVQTVPAIVNRPCKRAQTELVLVDSANGPFLSASHLRGAGYLWRIGGGVNEKENTLVTACVSAVVEKLAETPKPGKTKIGLIMLNNGPQSGGWTSISAKTWRDRLMTLGAVKISNVEFTILATPREWIDAARSGSFLAILNPYGEWLPVPADATITTCMPVIQKYVQTGGNWFEVAGYSFYAALKAAPYYQYSVAYPPGFADFAHFDTLEGQASIYGVQPRSWRDWSGKQDASKIFVPAAIDCGADNSGGYYSHAFQTYISPGAKWTTPILRISFGRSAPQALHDYAAANGFIRGLDQKMTAKTFEKFKQSVLVYYSGTAREKIDGLKQLPVPTLIHFADYLHGGFDKQYPDHLPPNPTFGDASDLRRFFDLAHSMGHLIMPYTNPTWWCEGPKGPTFEREGDAPLLRGMDGKIQHEQYSQNGGFSITPWHPAVQTANRKTRTEFMTEYPVDVLFQDQVGARGCQLDLNPESPAPYAYSEGWLSQAGEDSRIVPLATEDGWDQLSNSESIFCGNTWRLVPTQPGPEWRTFLKDEYSPATWTVYPLAEYVSHSTNAMVHHDLGQFVTNRETAAWTLALGYGMSFTTSASGLSLDRTHEWLRWLDRLQKSVCARYTGQPLTSFTHDRGPSPSKDDDGMIRATYGDVNIVANVGTREHKESGQTIPAFGFIAKAPETIAADVTDNGSQFGYVAQGNAHRSDLWVYGYPNQLVNVKLPFQADGLFEVTSDGGSAMRERASAGTLEIRTSPRPGQQIVEPPADLAMKAPRDWPNAHLSIGILDINGIPSSFTVIDPSRWKSALMASSLARDSGVSVRMLTTISDLVDALKQRPTQCLAIINPYGENFPEFAQGKWKDTLSLIRDYTRHGGNWWETGGYLLYTAHYLDKGEWKAEHIGSDGAQFLGLAVGDGDVDQAPEALLTTPTGKTFLGEACGRTVDASLSPVNRALLNDDTAIPHITLIQGAGGDDYLGGYQLGGWGWIWRFGGMNPAPEAALPAAIATMQYIYSHPPTHSMPGGVRHLQHYVLSHP